MPRPEYATPTIYAQVPQEIKDMMDDIRAFLGERSEKAALIEVIQEYHRKHDVPRRKRKKA